MALLEARNVAKSFVTGRSVTGRPRHVLQAVRDVSLSVGAGETLAIVGESGSGKSTLARLVLRLIEPDAGTVDFEGRSVTGLDRRELRAFRRNAQMIFQDPFSSLDPRMPVVDQVAEPLLVHRLVDNRAQRRERARELMSAVGLGDDHLDRRPHEFSGGQLQRVAIARALATEPRLLVCDEPVAALDMSIRAEVVNLLRDLQRERGIALLFISHDLSLVQLIAHRVLVMYQGEVVEQGPTDRVFAAPGEPYTHALLDAIPVPDPRRRRFVRPAVTVSPPSTGEMGLQR